MSNLTLINLPPPPSDPNTPSELGPGTPNSGTTSLSALSTTAIKDGHQGQAPPHPHHHHHHRSSSIDSSSSTNTLDAERADRISRLAGLERVATARQGSNGPVSTLAPGAGLSSVPGYFDNSAVLPGKERSTVGSASATGSAGGRTTWADGSDAYEADKMSEDQDDGVSSAGLSDEGNASLVGFGEGAGSTVSGPISTSGRVGVWQQSGFGSPSGTKGSGYVPRDGGSPMQGVQVEKAKMLDGMTYDRDVVDTTAHGLQGRNANMTGQETAERIIRERHNQANK